MKYKYLFLLTLLISSLGIHAQSIEENLKKHNIVLPKAPSAVGNYTPAKVVGKLVYINQIALVEAKVLTPGIVGKTVSEKDSKEATRQAMLNVIAVLKQTVGGDLNKVKQAVQMTGIFNTEAGYTQHAVLMNEASDLLIKVFGEKGVHTRATLGASSLPMDSPVEIQAIFELE